MTSTNTILTTNYSNFNFSLDIYETLESYVHTILRFFIKHKIKNPTLDSCFQTSMTLFQIKLDIETIKQITYNTYYVTSNYPELLNC
jgi:hypothetical protein